MRTLHHAALLILVLLPGAARAQEKPRLVLMNVTGGDPALAQLVNEYLLTEFQAAQRYEVIGGSDVVALLENEAQKQLMGCDEDECLSQIAGAMNAGFLAVSSMGELGGGYLFNLKILDTRDTKVLARASVKADHDQEQLLAAVRRAVRLVTGTANFTDSLPGLTIPSVALWSGAAVAAAVGIGFGVKAQGHHNDFMNPTYADYRGAARAGEESMIVANAMFITAGLSAAAGVVTWLLTGDRVELVPQADAPSAGGSAPSAALVP